MLRRKLKTMPSCVIKNCKNNSTFQKKATGITFHRFPKNNEPWKSDWIEIVRKSRCKNDWIPSSTSVVCSTHFEENDFYTTIKGYRRMVTHAVPKKDEDTLRTWVKTSFIANDSIFENLELEHTFAGVEHKISLIKAIAEKYLAIRFHHISKLEGITRSLGSKSI